MRERVKNNFIAWNVWFILFVSLSEFDSLFLFTHICSVFLCCVDKVQLNQIVCSFTLVSCMCVMNVMCMGEKRECIAQMVWCLWVLNSLCCHTCFPLWRFHITDITHAFKSRQPYKLCIVVNGPDNNYDDDDNSHTYTSTEQSMLSEFFEFTIPCALLLCYWFTVLIQIQLN